MDASQFIAHRGWQGKYPENTYRAIAGAIDAGAKNVEFDIQLSSDHVPVLY
ncbi:MAG: glycerophosphodiester phosphodiesterase, partial [Proteobacteria bacterium]|nr:glycerophosphodiester phosphodiesterase [Pseudomonadota bacterium]